MISAGQLNQRINIEQRSSSVDTLGQPVETWTLLAAVWANVKYPSGIASIKSDADVSVVKASIRIRYISSVNAGMRVAKGSEYFNILAVLPNVTQGYTDLVCEKV